MTDLERATRAMLDHKMTLADALLAMRTVCICEALERTGGNVTQAAQILGVHRNTVQSFVRLMRMAQ